MRYPASEKAEIIRLVEASHLSARRTLEKLGVPRATFYRWYDRYLTGGVEALDDRRSRPDRVWNRLPDPIRAEIIELALRETELSPRELAVRFTDEKRHFVSVIPGYDGPRHKDALARRMPTGVMSGRCRRQAARRAAIIRKPP